MGDTKLGTQLVELAELVTHYWDAFALAHDEFLKAANGGRQDAAAKGVPYPDMSDGDQVFTAAISDLLSIVLHMDFPDDDPKLESL